MCRGHDSIGLLSALQRELSLAMEGFQYRRGFRRLCFRKCNDLLASEYQFWELDFGSPVPRLQCTDQLPLLHFDRSVFYLL